jgi:hypothetical protein
MYRITALGADYVATIGALARTEGAKRLSAGLRVRAVALPVLALGVVWLNVAVLLWLPTTPCAVAGTIANAALAGVASVHRARHLSSTFTESSTLDGLM